MVWPHSYLLSVDGVWYVRRFVRVPIIIFLVSSSRAHKKQSDRILQIVELYRLDFFSKFRIEDIPQRLSKKGKPQSGKNEGDSSGDDQPWGVSNKGIPIV